MDAEGEIEISVRGGKHLDVNIIGQNFNNYDAMISLAHFKGHPMGGFGGVLKNQSIGIASTSRQGLYPYEYRSFARFRKVLTLFRYPRGDRRYAPASRRLPESMTEAAKSIADYYNEQQKPILYINVINNLPSTVTALLNQRLPCNTILA